MSESGALLQNTGTATPIAEGENYGRTTRDALQAILVAAFQRVGGIYDYPTNDTIEAICALLNDPGYDVKGPMARDMLLAAYASGVEGDALWLDLTVAGLRALSVQLRATPHE